MGCLGTGVLNQRLGYGSGQSHIGSDCIRFALPRERDALLDFVIGPFRVVDMLCQILLHGTGSVGCWRAANPVRSQRLNGPPLRQQCTWLGFWVPDL